jgi:hypothetical protein
VTRKRLEKLKRELSELRGRTAIKSRELEQFAKKVGRRRSTRGKEPTYEMPGRRPLTIPHHSGDLKIGAKNNVLDALEADLPAYEEALDQSVAQGDDEK